jgi:hypothetical protein
MDKFQLYLETSNEELFNKVVSEKGNMFYRKDGDNYEIVYFSGSRVARFFGKLTDKTVKLLPAIAHEVCLIEIQDYQVKIVE